MQGVATLRLVCVGLLLALAATSLAVAVAGQAEDDPGQLDLTLRPPAQAAFRIGDNGRPYGITNVEATAGDQVDATMDLRVFRGLNTLTSEVPWNVTWSLQDHAGIRVALLDAIEGRFGADTEPPLKLMFQGVIPADLANGSYDFVFDLTTGPYDPNPDNDDPAPIAVQIGQAPPTTAYQAQGWRAWSGLVASIVLIGVPVVAMNVPAVRATVAHMGRVRDGLAWRRDAFLQRPRLERQRLGRAAGLVVALVVAGAFAALHGSLAHGVTGILEVLLIGGVTASGAVAVRLLRKRTQSHPEAAATGMLGDAALLGGLVGAIALAWQQLSALTTYARWPALSDLGPYILIGLSVGTLIGLIALGYTMVYGVLKFINFAHGEVFLWGGYLTWMFVVLYPVLPLWAAIIVGAALTAAMGAIIERVAYRPLRGGNRLAPLITAIAVSLLLSSLAQFVFGARAVSFYQAGSTYAGSALATWLGADVQLLGASMDRLTVVTAAVSVALMFGLHLFVSRTRAGRAIRAVADDMETARIVGINVDRAITLTFVIGSVLAAVGGAFYGLRFTLSPTTGLLVGITAFTAAVVGGIGSIHGAFLGALLIGLLVNVGGQFIDTRFQNVITFGVLILFLLFRPQGILGTMTGALRR